MGLEGEGGWGVLFSSCLWFSMCIGIGRGVPCRLCVCVCLVCTSRDVMVPCISGGWFHIVEGKVT
jgi:hypothetical protein